MMSPQSDNENATDTAKRGRPHIRRRLTVLNLAVVPISVALAACASPTRSTHRSTGYTDSDPTDPPGAGRGRLSRSGATDSDPSDPPGGGRRVIRRTGLTDSDPTDRAGYGRGRR